MNRQVDCVVSPKWTGLKKERKKERKQANVVREAEENKGQIRDKGSNLGNNNDNKKIKIGMQRMSRTSAMYL